MLTLRVFIICMEVLVFAGVLVLSLLTRLPLLGVFVWIVEVFIGAGALAQAVVAREGGGSGAR